MVWGSRTEKVCKDMRASVSSLKLKHNRSAAFYGLADKICSTVALGGSCGLTITSAMQASDGLASVIVSAIVTFALGAQKAFELRLKASGHSLASSELDELGAKIDAMLAMDEDKRIPANQFIREVAARKAEIRKFTPIVGVVSQINGSPVTSRRTRMVPQENR